MDLYYPETADESARLARVVLPLATSHKLPVNPVNYAVLYEYVAARNTELRVRAEALLKRSDSVAQNDMNELFQAYVAKESSAAVSAVRNELRSILSSALSSVAELGGGGEKFRVDLEHSITRLSSGSADTEMRDVVEEVLRHTQSMVKTTVQAQERLNASTKELEALRVEIERTRSEAQIDPLTGVNNRRVFDRYINEQCPELVRKGTPVSLLMVDIDHFKKINDTHGHVVGDQVIKFVANALKDVVRGGDKVARYGGEEFAVVLPNTLLDNAARVATNILERIRKPVLTKKDGGERIGQVTVSIGVAQHDGTESAEHFIARADTALYMAKHEGRNRVCKADGDRRFTAS